MKIIQFFLLILLNCGGIKFFQFSFKFVEILLTFSLRLVICGKNFKEFPKIYFLSARFRIKEIAGLFVVEVV